MRCLRLGNSNIWYNRYLNAYPFKALTCLIARILLVISYNPTIWYRKRVVNNDRFFLSKNLMHWLFSLSKKVHVTDLIIQIQTKYFTLSSFSFYVCEHV